MTEDARELVVVDAIRRGLIAPFRRPEMLRDGPSDPSELAAFIERFADEHRDEQARPQPRSAGLLELMPRRLSSILRAPPLNEWSEDDEKIEELRVAFLTAVERFRRFAPGSRHAPLDDEDADWIEGWLHDTSAASVEIAFRTRYSEGVVIIDQLERLAGWLAARRRWKEGKLPKVETMLAVEFVHYIVHRDQRDRWGLFWCVHGGDLSMDVPRKTACRIAAAALAEAELIVDAAVESTVDDLRKNHVYRSGPRPTVDGGAVWFSDEGDDDV